MSGHPSVVVSLNGHVHDPQRPLLFADELAALRGDGVFETLLVRDGRPCLVDAHLRRLRQSAAAMDLAEPDLALWRRAIEIAVDEWNLSTSGEGALRLIYSRGREHGGAPTAYLTVNPVPARSLAARRDGIAALLLDRGLKAVADDHEPWLLAGAKTLSYAVNMAALRHAAKAGADDVVFVSSDGYILEGPRSTVVVATGSDSAGFRLITPPTSFPILCGTTQQALFEVAGDKGYDCRYEPLTPSDLFAAQGVWLVSSMTLAVRLRTLDGRPLPTEALATEFGALIDAAVTGDSR
jgi:4-amino-4-deoxychorismate lyase